MRFSKSTSLSLALCARALAAPSVGLESRDLNSFVISEKAIALQGALNNIGPHGSKVPGAAAGLVVASPSKSNPDCEYNLDLIL
jgi:glucoamylase